MTDRHRTRHQPSRTSKATRIEQAIAFGRTEEWMWTHLGATAVEVGVVREGMDAVNAESDVAEPKPGTGPADPAVVAELLDALVPRRNRTPEGRYAS